MTVAELLNRISSKELTEWMAFYELEPFGYDAENLGHAITASTIANVNRQKGQKPYTIADFMPHEKQEQSIDQMLQIAQAYTIALGGSDNREEK